MLYKFHGPVDKGLAKLSDVFASDPDKVIVIDVHSEGGSCSELSYILSNIDAAKQDGKTVITACSGIACSAGGTILFQGDQVYLGIASLILLHEATNDFCSPYYMCKFYFDRVKNRLLGDKKADMLEIHNKLLSSFEPWSSILDFFGEEKIRNDYTFTAEEAKRMFPDRVMVEAIPLAFRTGRIVSINQDMDVSIMSYKEALEDDEAVIEM